MKKIIFNTTKGKKYSVPLEYIAKHRADCYKEEYNAEVDFVMNDKYEGIDWLQNNMNFEDIKNIVTEVEQEEYKEEIDVNGEFKIL